MTFGYIRVQGTHYTAETITTETESTRVEGVINEQTETFNVAVSIDEDYEFALDIFTAVLDNKTEQVVTTVLPEEVHETINFDADDIDVEAGIEDTTLAYGLASRVAGHNKPDAAVLGEAATHVEGILLDFAMGRRGEDINGLHSAARAALVEHAFEDMTAGDATYGADDREEITAEANTQD